MSIAFAVFPRTALSTIFIVAVGTPREVGYADDMSLKMTVSSNAEKDDTIVTPEIPTGAADITDLFVSAIKTKNN